MKRRGKCLAALALTGALIITSIPVSPGGRNPGVAYAADTEAKADIQNGKVAIGNVYLERVFDTSGGKLATEKMDNKRADLDFVPASGSEEFIIQLRQDTIQIEGEIDRSGWSAEASDQYNNTPGASDGPGSNTIDNNESTIWHSKYSPDTPYPHHLIFDMQKEETIAAFSYLPRQDSSTNGDIGEYELYVGNDKATLESAENLAAKGTFTYNGRECIYVNLSEAKKGRYVELKAVSPKTAGQAWTTAAEVKMYSKAIDTEEGKQEMRIKASDMTLDTSNIRAVDTKAGIMVEFPFETFYKNGVNWDVTMKVVMEDGDHFMRKFLEIQVDDPEHAVLDYIDLESMNVNETDAVWTHPVMGAGVGGMSGDIISLGQPVYIQGMFFGCEFPMTETEIDSSQNAHMRYYSGKSFRQLEEDHQMTVDGKYVTWQTVAGAARSTDMDVIQSDFYEYIDSIATKTDFRTQYNSWYDNMMTINDSNIDSAFTRMEKGLSESGVIPMDSYVVDDGWNNYNTTKYGVHDVARCGTTNNETGFWEFNNKFPSGFRPAQQLAESFGSSFGVWLGPRGGYNFNGAMGRIIEDAGYGAYNAQSGDIDVGDRRYVSKLTEFFTQMQDAYKINYWKLDGFATKACTNTSHKHMTGGKNGMYYFTDTWEAWIDLIEALRANAEKNGIDNLWFNLTCYVNPSPWYLQWANSIWIQNSNDIGRISVGQTRQVDQLLSYRDGRYFDFVKERQFQFPLANVYNHDPIYGKTDTGLANTMTNEEFKTYLYMMATRGTAFWELYYSPEMIDEGEKWAVNAEFLDWARKNYHILKNAKLLGATPDGGNTYGYSCWDKEEGIISMRNPSASVKTLTFTLDRNIGVSEELEGKTLIRTTILDYKTTDAQTEYTTLRYGDTISITLQPGEARIWSLSTEADETAASVTRAKTGSSTTIELTFDERVSVEAASARVTGNSVTDIYLAADEKKVTLTLGSPLAVGDTASVRLTGIQDLSGNTKTYDLEVPYYENDLVAKAYTASELKNASGVTESTDAQLEGKNTIALTKAYDLASSDSITGDADFSVSAYIRTTGKDADLLKQGDEYSLSIDADGNLVFTVGDVSVTSKEAVDDGTWKHVAGIRERNGVIKVYINGTLSNSKYDISGGIRDIDAAAVTLGSAGLSMQVSEAEVKNSTLMLADLDEKKSAVGEESGGTGSGIVPDENGKIPLEASRISVKRADTDEDISNSQSPAGKMIDGDTGTNSYTCTADSFESAALAGTSAYFQIDLGDVFKLDKVKMWRYYADGRTYQDTIVIASKDAVFDQKDTVLFSSVSRADQAYGLLSDAKLADPDEAYAETSAGKIFEADGEEVRYIRIYMRGSVLTTGGSHGGNHVCEVEVYGESLGGGEETKPDSFTITFDTKGGNTISSLKVKAGESWELPETPVREGYVFKGWYSNVNCTVPYTEAAPVNADLHLFADWTKQYKVSFQTAGGTEIADASVVDGETVSMPEDPVRGIDTFEGWYTDYACTKAFDPAAAITKDTILYAKWTKNVDPEYEQAKEQLNAQVAEAREMKQGNYTDASWKAFQEAILAAEKAIEEGTSAEVLKAALQDLERAKANLQTLQTETETPSTETEAPQKVQLAAPKISSAKSSYKGVTVKWAKVSGAVSYTIKRNGKTIGTTAGASFLDKTPKGGAVNRYEVCANGDNVKTITSASAVISTKKLPKAVTGLKAKKSGSKITVSWKKQKDAAGYVVLKATSANGTYKKVKELKKTSFTDSKVKGKVVYYKVVAKSKKLYGPASKSKKVKK